MRLGKIMQQTMVNTHIVMAEHFAFKQTLGKQLKLCALLLDELCSALISTTHQRASLVIKRFSSLH